MFVVVNAEVVQQVLKFLERVNLQGIEAMTFAHCVTQLQRAPNVDTIKKEAEASVAVPPPAKPGRKKKITSVTSDPL